MSASVIEEAVLVELEAVVGPEVVAELVVSFQDDAKSLGEKLRTAHAAGDVKGVLASSHTLKSTSETLGALALGKTCGVIEALARTGTLASAEQLALFEADLKSVLAAFAARC